MSTVSVGNKAEAAAAAYLVEQGYDIVEMNFRRPYCEIDIVAKYIDTIYFVEVKYRASASYGSGLDYIVPIKLRHMERAAQTWVSANQWHGAYTISAIEVEGADFSVGEFVESIY